MEKKLEVKNLRISFKTDAGKVQAVRGIDFDLYKGETLAIVGESGSGKSVTNKAIIGISSNNAIIESGKIIYDGQDLIQISEEDFHKLRGDKIAMIFQDPLSALDPINKIGIQLTEAMLLKNKSNIRQSKHDFNYIMKNLLHYMNHGMDSHHKDPQGIINKNKCDNFNSFEILHLKLEGAYKTAYDNAKTCSEDIEDLLFHIEKNAVSDFYHTFKSIYYQSKHSIHEYVCDSSIMEVRKELLKSVVELYKTKDYKKLVEPLTKLNEKLKLGLSKEMPNYFALAYFMKFSNEEIPAFNSVSELNSYMRNYLDEHFMLQFIKDSETAIAYDFKRTKIKKQRAIDALIDAKENVFDFLKTTDNISKYKKAAKELYVHVDNAINRLDLVKDSLAFTFPSSLDKALNIYFIAEKNNKKEQKRFNKETAKINKLIAKGKVPEYKVIPAKIIDTNLAKQNILDIINDLIEHYQDFIKNAKIDAHKQAIDTIDYLKNKAQAASYKLSKSIAKSKALKLMEEVGIPEPRKRFKQYPFEFSGGMRQRIVIAIALSADPDILICDEPTTALDVTIQSQILELINKIKKERNLSVIFITHDLGVVANMADRVAVMYAGKIVEYGSVDEIFYDPKHPYTWALLSSMPDLDTNEKLEAIPGTPPNMIYPPKGDAFAARNKYALKIDFEEEPPMFKVSDTHYAATWLLHENAPKLNPPKAVTDRIQRMKILNK